MPIGMPGCPDFACSTASAARKRIALAHVRSSVLSVCGAVLTTASGTGEGCGTIAAAGIAPRGASADRAGKSCGRGVLRVGGRTPDRGLRIEHDGDRQARE